MLRDIDIRKVLIEYIQEINKDSDYRIINEMAVCDGEARIDIAVANGYLCGYEIKSDVDKLSRLDSQCLSYNKIFDKMYIVIGEKYKNIIKEYIPTWWGIIFLTKNYELKIIRKSKINKEIRINSWLELLWRDEVYALLKNNSIRGLSGKNRRILRDIAIKKLSKETIIDYTLCTLKNREGWRETII